MARSLDYAHANMRLKTRYGIEITMSEWLQIGNLFATNSSKIVNPRKNHVGDVEGWVEIDGQWVCAYWSAKRRCIATFYARPPDIAPAPPAPAPAPPLTPEQEAAKETRKIKQGMIDDANRRASLAADDVVWFKQRMHDVARVLKAGCTEEAYTMLRALASIPKSVSPTRDKQVLERFLDESFESRRKYLETLEEISDSSVNLT